MGFLASLLASLLKGAKSHWKAILLVGMAYVFWSQHRDFLHTKAELTASQSAQAVDEASIKTLRGQLQASNQASLDRAREYAASKAAFQSATADNARKAEKTDKVIASLQGLATHPVYTQDCRTPDEIRKALEGL